ncbi:MULTISPECIES: 16S rRNA (guanine(527)-N(7))-methyltransferase RsmG [Brevundimonas]|uniref:Ribosomal RNA small subunit methyltransferase G n=1 Tax=Brevundimonas abyssalis TAR-001 TaxID=1391729 RepID=A0A8E0KKJ6_9CAUL|nr:MULTISPECIES: 16S rRNA (guanine(527)-N(7))-methyltransferase RsmG [Brevundimonas]GAD58299.1 rRNA small subunit methyltransferase, glucose inhibited division protein GidB [Brevundimonas abyssalis TAR-001]
MSLTAAQFQALSGATDAQIADLERFRVLLTEANQVMNLVGPSTLPDYWSRHVLDSWQLIDHAPDALTWADLGAGAGVPGVVLAIFLKGRPGAHVHLIDSLGKRCRFLEQVKTELDLPATVINGRAEEQAITVDVVTARAVAPMDKLLGYAQPYMDRGAQGLFLKGEKAPDELKSARLSWHFKAQLHPSRLTDGRGHVVQVRGLRRAR